MTLAERERFPGRDRQSGGAPALPDGGALRPLACPVHRNLEKGQ